MLKLGRARTASSALFRSSGHRLTSLLHRTCMAVSGFDVHHSATRRQSTSDSSAQSNKSTSGPRHSRMCSSRSSTTARGTSDQTSFGGRLFRECHCVPTSIRSEASSQAPHRASSEAHAPATAIILNSFSFLMNMSSSKHPRGTCAQRYSAAPGLVGSRSFANQEKGGVARRRVPSSIHMRHSIERASTGFAPVRSASHRIPSTNEASRPSLSSASGDGSRPRTIAATMSWSAILSSVSKWRSVRS